MNELMPSLVSALRADVDAICLPEGRMVGSSGHRLVRERLAYRLREIGCEPWSDSTFELPYARGGTSFRNLIGVIKGRNPRLAPILVGAHYDGVMAAPCADDNAAAVAIALAVGGRAAASQPLERDLVVALFDAEEPPFFRSPAMGSIRFWEDQRGGRPVHAALILDLVGHDVRVDNLALMPMASLNRLLAPLVFITGTESHAGLRSVHEQAGTVDGLSLVPTLNRYIGDMSDHGVFRENGVPYLFLSCGRWRHYHQETDTPDRLNYEKMDRIARQVLACAAALDGAELPQTGREQFAETLDLEISRLRVALGSGWKLLLERCGLSDVTSRDEMDRFVFSLQRLGI